MGWLNKCGHCRRRPNRRKRAVEASDGSRLVSCACGKSWVRKPSDDRAFDLAPSTSIPTGEVE